MAKSKSPEADLEDHTARAEGLIREYGRRGADKTNIFIQLEKVRGAITTLLEKIHGDDWFEASTDDPRLDQLFGNIGAIARGQERKLPPPGPIKKSITSKRAKTAAYLANPAQVDRIR